MTSEELARLILQVGELRGWDWSRLRADRDPVPWDYLEVARQFLSPTSSVLDVGTGGGEKFLSLAPHFGRGIGIDHKEQMIRTALENRPPALRDVVAFQVMRAQKLTFADGTFDVALNRHAAIFHEEIIRVLKPGGYFITQQVGGRNTQSIFDVFDWGSNGEYWQKFFTERGMTFRTCAELRGVFEAVGCRVTTYGEYDVRYFFRDVESVVFWLLWSPLPERLDPTRHAGAVTQLIEEYQTSRGIETNEHRELLIARKV